MPHPAGRRGLGLGARRRLRAGAALRPDRRLGDGRVRPARDHAGDHPRRRRHPAAGPRRSASSGRWSWCSPAAASTPREAERIGPRERGRREERVARRGARARAPDREAAADRRPARQAGGARRRGDRAGRGARARAAALRAGDGDRGPGRGDAGVPREAQPRVPGHDERPAVGVAGAGTMGAGIAQLACLGGFETRLHDPDPRRSRAGAERLRGEPRRRAPASAAAGAAEAEAAARAARRGAGARRPRGLRAGDRGRARGPGAEARAVRPARGVCAAGRRPGHQHLVAVGHRDRRRASRVPSGSAGCTSSTRRR